MDFFISCFILKLEKLEKYGNLKQEFLETRDELKKNVRINMKIKQALTSNKFCLILSITPNIYFKN